MSWSIQFSHLSTLRHCHLACAQQRKGWFCVAPLQMQQGCQWSVIAQFHFTWIRHFCELAHKEQVRCLYEHASAQHSATGLQELAGSGRMHASLHAALRQYYLHCVDFLSLKTGYELTLTC